VLGADGYLAELIELTLPNFDLTFHGLQVGNNLIKAFLELGQIESAYNLVQKLYEQDRPDWKPTLAFWEQEIAQVRSAATPVDGNEKA
jgi:hypothetical protein